MEPASGPHLRAQPLARPVAPRLHPASLSGNRWPSTTVGMFFFTYLARELRRRLRQAIFIALGLAVGVGLVLTVTAASKGVKDAQAGVLKGLYGVGTDITVTKPPPAFNPNAAGNG